MENQVDRADMPAKSCVEIRHAHKSYSFSVVILDGLNMTVPEGIIYSLLGPSGCGKTTLLNCIVGRSKIDSGSVRVSANRRSEIGLMPQTLSIFPDLTIYENLLVFGYLFSMTKEQILARADELLSFLDLPSGHRFVNTLSGGQQRRVSLAVTFIHDPRILILDEPTVGLDIYLVQCIWERFVDLVRNQGKTIIFTTQYNQEAMRADKIGFMRKGVLLAEEQPQALIQKHNCQDLEESFRLLCHKQETDAAKPAKKRKLSRQISRQLLGNPDATKTSFEDDDKMISRQKLKGVLYKNFTQLKRSYAYIFMVIVLPLESLYAFNAGYGHKPEQLHLAVVNDEIPLENCTLFSYSDCLLDADNLSLSCLYVDMMRKKTYGIDKYDSRMEALESVRKNRAWGVLHFPKNYTRSLMKTVVNGRKAVEEDFNAGSVDAWVDLSDQVSGSFVKVDMMVALRMFLRQAYTNCGLNPKFGDVPIHFQEPLYPSGAEESAYLASVSPAGLCVFCFSFAIAAAALGGATERLEGTMDRMLVTGVSLHTFLAGFMIIQILINTIRGLMLMAVTYLVFDNPQRGNYVTLNWLMFFIGVLGTLWGIALAIIWENITIVVLAGLSVTFIFTLTTGLLWPMEGQHPLLKSVNWIFPLPWTVKASEAIAFRSDTFTDKIVLKGFGVTTVWICLFVSLINSLIKYKTDL